jgi:glycosyltransferase involved in cell wall biosynthesis
MSRLAYICADPGVPVFGRKGCSVHVQEMLRAFAKCGVDIELFATSSGGEAPAGLERIGFHQLPPAPKGDLGFREQQCLACNGPLQAMLERERRFDLVYERYSLWSFAAMEFAHSRSIPALLEVNAPLIEEQAEYRGLVERAGALAAARRVFSSASCILAVSEGMAGYLEKFPETGAKVHVLPNGVRPERFPTGTRSSLPALTGTFTVGFIGSMKPWHGVDDLLEAFAHLQARESNNRLLLVGDGPTRIELEARAHSLGLSSAVHFTGAVMPAEVPGLLASMDVAVAPYPERPNFYFSPLKVYEYMAAGLPVIATAVGQLKELIEPDISGILVPPSRPAALASALLQLRQQPELRARLGRSARAKVLNEFTWERNAHRILQLAGLAPYIPLESSEAGATHAAT